MNDRESLKATEFELLRKVAKAAYDFLQGENYWAGPGDGLNAHRILEAAVDTLHDFLHTHPEVLK